MTWYIVAQFTDVREKNEMMCYQERDRARTECRVLISNLDLVNLFNNLYLSNRHYAVCSPFSIFLFQSPQFFSFSFLHMRKLKWTERLSNLPKRVLSRAELVPSSICLSNVCLSHWATLPGPHEAVWGAGFHQERVLKDWVGTSI